jgi:hypothetical protein
VGGEGVIRRNGGAGIIFTRATARLKKRSDEKVSRSGWSQMDEERKFQNVSEWKVAVVLLSQCF